MFFIKQRFNYSLSLSAASCDGRSANKDRSSGLAAKYLFALFLAAFLSGMSTVSAQTNDELKAQNKSELTPTTKMLLSELPSNIARMEACGNILTQELLDSVSVSDEDPEEAFEKWRIEKRTMMEASPLVECQSKLWRALKAKNNSDYLNIFSVSPKAKQEMGVSYQPSALEQILSQFAPVISANYNPSSGVEAYQGEVQIAVNPNNPLQMVAGANSFYRDPSPVCQSPTGGAANTYGTQALYGSTDGGLTWTYRCAPWNPSVTGGVTGASAWFGSDPAMAWDKQGNAYAVYMLISQNSAGTAAGASIVISKSTDVGNTWTPLGAITTNITSSSTNFDDKEMVAIDNSAGPASTKSHPGRIYVIWDRDNVQRVAYSDNGSTWTEVVLPTPSVGSYDIGGDIKVGPDGTVYAIWNRLVYSGSTQSGERTVFSKSVNGGVTWSTPLVIASQALLSFGTNNKPPAQDSRGINAFASLGIDSNPASAYYGTVYAAYPDFPSGTTSGANINIYLVKSTNGGASWSTPVKVNDDAGTATQIFPWLSIDQSDGSVNVSWYDSRIDPANNRKTQLFYARSSNGGASFEPNILVNDNGGVVWNNMIDYSNLNTTDNTSRNANQYGDYSGIAAINRKVIPFWTDSRSYFPNADTASPSRREDAASAIIVNCSAPSAPVALNSVINPNNTASVILNWGTSSDWGTNATDGTYSVYRATTPTLPANAVPIASSLTMPTFTDTTGTLTATYYYFVEAKNNCPGTALTPMSTVSTVSNAIVFPTGGSQVGTIQGNVTVNNQALSGVIISAGGAYSAVTDTNGFYQILGVPVASYTLTATATDYETNSASSISVNNGGTTVHNFALIPLSVQRAATDTTQSDFQAGTASSIDLTSAPGDLKLSLSGSEAVNQQNTSLGSSGNGITTTTWEAQTFTATASGKLTKLEAALFCSGCTGTTQPVTVEIRTVSGGLPTTTVLATTTIAAFSSGATAYYTATFANPATITAGTTYSFVLRMLANPSPGTYASTRSGSNVYAGGAWIQSTNSGASWTAQSQDLGFKVYITPATFATSGTFVSSVKDAAPVLGATTDNAG
jgi:hypothetical protein